MKLNFMRFLKKRGMTLIELILAIAIFSVIFLLLSQIFNLSLKSLREIRRNSSESYEVYRTLAYIENDFRNANIIREYNDDPHSVGFILIEFNKNYKSTAEDKYRYIYYKVGTYKKSNKKYYQLYRNAISYPILTDYCSYPSKKKPNNIMLKGIENYDFVMDKGGIKILIDMPNSDRYEKYIAFRGFL